MHSKHMVSVGGMSQTISFVMQTLLLLMRSDYHELLHINISLLENINEMYMMIKMMIKIKKLTSV